MSWDDQSNGRRIHGEEKPLIQRIFGTEPEVIVPRALILVLFIVLIPMFIFSRSKEGIEIRDSAFRLRLGTSAGQGQFRVPIQPLANLSGVSVAEIGGRRGAFLSALGELVETPYTPTAMFSGIDKSAHWRTIGELAFGTVPEGLDSDLSAESRIIVNPLALISASFSFKSDGGILPWNKEKASPKTLLGADIPLIPLPSSILITPSKREIRAEYPVTEWLEKIAPYLASSVSPTDLSISLITSNAFDLGFSYMEIDREHSEGVTLTQSTSEILSTAQPYLLFPKGFNGSGAPSNGRSPIAEEARNILISAVPSTLTINLWSASSNPKESPAELVYYIIIN